MGTTGKVKKFTVNSENADLQGKVGNNSKFSSSVDAVVDWFGPTSFRIVDACDPKMTHNAVDSPIKSKYNIKFINYVRLAIFFVAISD